MPNRSFIYAAGLHSEPLVLSGSRQHAEQVPRRGRQPRFNHLNSRKRLWRWDVLLLLLLPYTILEIESNLGLCRRPLAGWKTQQATEQA